MTVYKREPMALFLHSQKRHSSNTLSAHGKDTILIVLFWKNKGGHQLDRSRTSSEEIWQFDSC